MYCLLISLFLKSVEVCLFDVYFSSYIYIFTISCYLLRIYIYKYVSPLYVMSHISTCFVSVFTWVSPASPVVLPVDRWGAVIVQLLFWSIDLCHLEISGSRKINGLNLREPKGLKNLIYTNWFVVLLCDCFMILLELWPLRSQRWYCKPIFINLSKNL